jgi:hypothetical protein
MHETRLRLDKGQVRVEGKPGRAHVGDQRDRSRRRRDCGFEMTIADVVLHASQAKAAMPLPGLGLSHRPSRQCPAALRPTG